MTKGKLYEINPFDWREANFLDSYTVKEALDEAKKEFPADSHGLHVEEVMAWFWKWFGDEL